MRTSFSIPPRSGDGIPSLPTIQFLLLKYIQAPHKVFNINSLFVKPIQALDKSLPNGSSLPLAEGGIVQCQLNARFERLIEGTCAVDGQDQDSLEIFHHA